MKNYLVTWNDDERYFTHYEPTEDGNFRCTHGGWVATLLERENGSCEINIGGWKTLYFANYKFTDCKSAEDYSQGFSYD